MKKTITKKEILEHYKKEGEEILGEMYAVLVRAQRKIDDEAYRQALKKTS